MLEKQWRNASGVVDRSDFSGESYKAGKFVQFCARFERYRPTDGDGRPRRTDNRFLVGAVVRFRLPTERQISNNFNVETNSWKNPLSASNLRTLQ
jgi:hypothetical protein